MILTVYAPSNQASKMHEAKTNKANRRNKHQHLLQHLLLTTDRTTRQKINRNIKELNDPINQEVEIYLCKTSHSITA